MAEEFERSVKKFIFAEVKRVLRQVELLHKKMLLHGSLVYWSTILFKQKEDKKKKRDIAAVRTLNNISRGALKFK